jgi:uncharacterized membrane protein YeiH
MHDIIPNAELIFFIDMLAAVSFAVSGALVASRKNLDLLGFMWLAVITGVGGGTVRDLILDIPVFWVADPAHIVACLLTAVIMFFVAPHVASRLKLVLWFDAIGLSFVTVVGTVKGLEHGTGALIAIVMGVMTASVGGIIRDVIGGEISIIMRREIYVTAAVAGAICYIGLTALDTVPAIAAIASFVITLCIRGLAMTFNWSLPSHNKKLPHV